MMMETLIMKIKYPMKYDRELFKLSDGGTIALDWIRDDQNF
jgi:predicted alpha/beta-fold hydrolase